MARQMAGSAEVLALYGQATTPSISFKHARFAEEQTDRRGPQDWIDIVSTRVNAGRFEESIWDEIVEEPDAFDDADSVDASMNLDPADRVRTKRPARVWDDDPRTPGWRPNVVVGRFYLDRLAVAERALDLAKTMEGPAVIFRLADETGLTSSEVVEALKWMGVADEVNASRTPYAGPLTILPERDWTWGEPPHGTNARYGSTKYRCRCDECREAHREYCRRYVAVKGSRRGRRATGRS